MLIRESLSVTHRAALPFLCLLSLALYLCHSPAYGDTGPGDWSMFHHDRQHTGRSSFSGSVSPVQRWALYMAFIDWSSPAIGADGTIYTVSDDGHLYALNQYGRQQWAFSIAFPAPNQDLGQYSSPAIGADGTIYVGSEDNNLYAIGGPAPTLTTPTITSFTPSSGGAGTVVTLTGTNFTGATAVTFDGTLAASFTVASATSITATVGSGATGTLTVTTPGGTAASSSVFTFTSAPTMPTITSFTPNSGSAGTVVTITGTNFTGATAVAFGGTAAASFTVVSATSLTATVGSGATGPLTVATPGGTATSTGAFTFNSSLSAPAITSFLPGSGGPGTVVSISGSGFSTANAVTIGGTPAAAFTVVNDTTITATVGSGATGPITVTTPGGQATSTFIFFFVPAPTITSFTPSSGGAGTVVTISGANFTGATAVAFGGTAAATFTVTNATTITAAVASGATGTLSVTTPNGTASSSGTFTYTAPTPPLTGVTLTTTPPSPVASGTPVNLLATANGGTSVQFQFWSYNPAATPAWSPLQAYSPQASYTWTPATGSYLLSVTAQDGASGTEVNTTAWYTITGGSPLTAVTVTPVLTAPQPANTPITLTATATGGTSVQFQFWLYNPAATPAWSQLQGYSSRNTCSWTPATAGRYLLSVTAQDGVTGTEVNTTLWYTVQ